VVRGFDRLTRTGIAILFVGIFVVVGLGIVFTQSPEIANPFVETFNFQTSEQVFPMLRFGDDPRRTSSTSAGSPPTGTFITCLNQIDGEFCTDILEDVNKLCTLKLIAVYRFDDGSSRTFTSSDQDNFFLLIPDFDITDPETDKKVDRLSIIPRLSCEAPVLKADGSRVDFAVTAENGRLAISVDAYDEFGNLIPVLVTRAITIPRTIFTDEGFFRIETERSLGSVDVTANEIENDLNPSRDFNTRVIVELDGKLFLEIEDLNSLTNNFVVTHDVGSRGDLPNPTNLMLDLFVDTEETSATVFKTTVSTIQPDTLVVDGDAGSSFKVNVFFTMTAYTDSEGVPECDVKEKGIFGATLGTTVKAVKVTSGEDAQFSCSIPVKGDTKTGIYEVKITSPSNTSVGSSRPQTTTTFTITLEADDTPVGGDDPVTCPSIDVLRQQIKDLTEEKLLQIKADLVDKQKRGTLTLCEAIQLPLVIAEVDSRGLTSAPTPTPTPTTPNGGLTCDPNTQVLTKISATQFTCVTKDPSSGGFGLPKFIACAQGVSADTTKGEICLPPSLFSLFQFVTNNLLLVGIGLVVFLIIVKVIFIAIGRAKGGVVLKD
jgi:hypothetical protein